MLACSLTYPSIHPFDRRAGHAIDKCTMPRRKANECTKRCLPLSFLSELRGGPAGAEEQAAARGEGEEGGQEAAAERRQRRVERHQEADGKEEGDCHGADGPGRHFAESNAYVTYGKKVLGWVGDGRTDDRATFAQKMQSDGEGRKCMLSARSVGRPANGFLGEPVSLFAEL